MVPTQEDVDCLFNPNTVIVQLLDSLGQCVDNTRELYRYETVDEHAILAVQKKVEEIKVLLTDIKNKAKEYDHEQPMIYVCTIS